MRGGEGLRCRFSRFWKFEMTNKEKAKRLHKIARNLSVWKESGPRGPEHSKEARKSAEESMKLLGVNADLLHYCKETYGVEHRQSELSISALNGILDGMRINNQPPEFITERIGWYDYQDFAQVAFINELNLWANKCEKDKTEQNAISARPERESWIWKLYEKTLKVIVDAVLERVWHP